MTMRDKVTPGGKDKKPKRRTSPTASREQSGEIFDRIDEEQLISEDDIALPEAGSNGILKEVPDVKELAQTAL